MSWQRVPAVQCLAEALAPEGSVSRADVAGPAVGPDQQVTETLSCAEAGPVRRDGECRTR